MEISSYSPVSADSADDGKIPKMVRHKAKTADNKMVFFMSGSPCLKIMIQTNAAPQTSRSGQILPSFFENHIEKTCLFMFILIGEYRDQEDGTIILIAKCCAK